MRWVVLASTTALRAAVPVAALVAGCGSASAPSAAHVSFPRPPGRIADLVREHPSSRVVLSLTVSRVRSGPHARIGFGLLDVGGKAIAPDAVALYLGRADGSHLRGPIAVTREALAVGPAFRARATGDAREVWVAHARVPRGPGWMTLIALVQQGGRRMRSSPATLRVDPPRGPPRPGDRAVRVHTDTIASAHGDLARIDTRVPPWPPLHRDDLAEVLGRRPVLLLFATPELCSSRVCGPVVDVAAEVQSRLGRRAVFIHEEIYSNNEIRRGTRPSVKAWRLPSEPWAFAIDARGRVRAELEGAFSTGELERAVRTALR